jgi:divalent metal cation (Fe/Co/Zn/Cd) transporter
VGRRYTAEIQILVSPTVTVEESHIIVSRLKTTLRQRIEHLEDIVITCKPYVEELKEVA